MAYVLFMQRTRSRVWALCLWLGLCFFAPVQAYAANVPANTNTQVEGIQSLPGTEVRPEDMQKAFPQPLQQRAPHMNFVPHAAPLIPELPMQTPTGGASTQGFEQALPLTQPQSKQPQSGAQPSIPTMFDGSTTSSPSSPMPAMSPSQGQGSSGQGTKGHIPLGQSFTPLEPTKPQSSQQQQEHMPPVDGAERLALPKHETLQEKHPNESLDVPSIESMVGQMIMGGFIGTELEKESPILALVREGKVGGIFLMPTAQKTQQLQAQPAGQQSMFAEPTLQKTVTEGNIVSPAQLRVLTAQLQSAAAASRLALPLFMAIEQEGGFVQALRTDLGFAGLAAAAHLGQQSVEATEIAARSAGLEMAGLGINVALGPAGDVNVNPLNENIGKRFRSFSTSPSIAAAHVAAFMRGLLAAKVIPCVRNFPGSGSPMGGFKVQTGQNILQNLQDIASTWQKRELEPYAAAVNLAKQKNAIIAVQPALAYHRSFDGLRPIPLSRTVLTGLLRQNLHFSGLIISQDLHALVPYFSLEEVILQAVLSGTDILLVSAKPDTAQETQASEGILSLFDGQNGLQNILETEQEFNTENLSPEALTKALLQQNLQNILPRGLGASVQEKPLSGKAAQALQVYEILLAHVQAGRIPLDRIRASWQRIRRAKEAMLIPRAHGF